MSATDELRRMLDERGVEHGWAENQPDQTWWKDQDGHIYFAKGINNPMFFNLTPAQAIAATLGPGTCQVDTTENWLPSERYHRCKHCGAFFAVLDASSDIPPRFCPNCGRRIEVEE